MNSVAGRWIAADKSDVLALHCRNSSLLCCIHNGVDVNGARFVARRETARPGIDRQQKIQGGKGTEDQSELGTGLAALDGDNPLPSNSRLSGEFLLAQLELAASFADGQTEVQRRSDLHDGSNVVEWRQSVNVAERIQYRNVSNRHVLRMCVPEDKLERVAKPRIAAIMDVGSPGWCPIPGAVPLVASGIDDRAQKGRVSTSVRSAII